MKFVVLLILCAFVSSCATAAKMNQVSIGMSKDDVMKVMGAPASLSADGDVELLNYALYETDQDAHNHHSTPYYVKIKDGKVAGYGRQGDFKN